MIHGQSLSPPNTQDFPPEERLDVPARPEVLRDEVESGKSGIVRRLENELAVRVRDAYGVQWRPGEPAVQRIVVARDGRVTGVDLPVYE